MIQITIHTDNAAFDDGLEGSTEVARILRQLSTDIAAEETIKGRFLRDINGNTVGKLDVVEE